MEYKVGDEVVTTVVFYPPEDSIIPIGSRGKIVGTDDRDVSYTLRINNHNYRVAEEDVTKNTVDFTTEDGTIKSLVENIPSDVLLQIGDVLSFGAKKYTPTQWRDKPTTPNKRIGSALRHIYSHQAGEELDKESELPHIHHAITQLLMAAHYINKGIDSE